MAEVALGALLDAACTEILRRDPASRGSRLVVHPDVYRAVARSRRREVDRGAPMMVLGLELKTSGEVPISMFRIAP